MGRGTGSFREREAASRERLSLVGARPQCKVFPNEGGEIRKLFLVPREEFSNHRLGALSAVDGPQGGGGSVQERNLDLGIGVAC